MLTLHRIFPRSRNIGWWATKNSAARCSALVATQRRHTKTSKPWSANQTHAPSPQHHHSHRSTPYNADFARVAAFLNAALFRKRSCSFATLHSSSFNTPTVLSQHTAPTHATFQSGAVHRVHPVHLTYLHCRCISVTFLATALWRETTTQWLP